MTDIQRLDYSKPPPGYGEPVRWLADSTAEMPEVLRG